MKRIVSFVIVAVMLLSIVSASVFAAEYTLGDVNKDGKYNLKDVVIIMKSIAGWDLEDGDLIRQYGDFNGDGKLNIMDVTNYLQWIAKWTYVYL